MINCRCWIVSCIFCGMLVASSAQAASRTRTNAVKRLERAEEYLRNMQEQPDDSIPAGLFSECRGIIILRQYKAGFVIGAKGGAGVALLRDAKTGGWSQPCFIKTGEGSIGFQIGGQSIDSIFLIMNQEGVEMLLKTKFKIGVDASAAAGPVGRDAEAKLGAGTAILAYSRAKGLYAGAAFEGGLLLIDGDSNDAFFGAEGVTIDQILVQRTVTVQKEAKGLVDLLTELAAVAQTGKEEVQSPAAKTEEPPAAKPEAPAPQVSERVTTREVPKPAAPAPEPAPASSRTKDEAIAELKRIKEMYENELITEAEYNELRQNILDTHFR